MYVCVCVCVCVSVCMCVIHLAYDTCMQETASDSQMRPGSGSLCMSLGPFTAVNKSGVPDRASYQGEGRVREAERGCFWSYSHPSLHIMDGWRQRYGDHNVGLLRSQTDRSGPVRGRVDL
jgi:hypothetical protein